MVGAGADSSAAFAIPGPPVVFAPGPPAAVGSGFGGAELPPAGSFPASGPRPSISSPMLTNHEGRAFWPRCAA